MAKKNNTAEVAALPAGYVPALILRIALASFQQAVGAAAGALASAVGSRLRGIGLFSFPF